MPLHPGQIKYIEDTTRLKTKINVLVPANRWAKTTTLALIQIWFNFYKFGVPDGNKAAWMKALYRTANVAPAAALVEPVFSYIDQILTSSFPIRLPNGTIVTNRCLIEWFYLKNKTTTKPSPRQYFANNSSIEHRTLGMTGADSLEGRPFGIITYDECGRSDHLEREVNGTLLARLFDFNGPLHLASTPDQSSSSILYHYELYTKGMNKLPGHYTMEGQLKDNIFFPKEQIEQQYRLYEGNPLKDQVLYGKFVFGGDNIYNAEDILAAKDESLNDGKRYIDGHKYIIATDTAIGADEMVHTVLDITDLEIEYHDNVSELKGRVELVKQVAAKGNSKSPTRHLNDFIDLYESYRTDTYSPDYILETWNGESVRYYHDLPDYIKVHTKCFGTWQPKRVTSDNKNNEKSKPRAAKKSDVLMAIAKMLSSRVLKIPAVDQNPVMYNNEDKPGADLVQQLTIYKEADNNLPTDRLFSLGLACHMAINENNGKKSITFIDW